MQPQFFPDTNILIPIALSQPPALTSVHDGSPIQLCLSVEIRGLAQMQSELKTIPNNNWFLPDISRNSSMERYLSGGFPVSVVEFSELSGLP